MKMGHFTLFWGKNTEDIFPGWSGLLQTLMYATRVALAYLVMLAVMSFNVGVLLASVGGYAVGFLVYGSQVFRKADFIQYEESSDIPPLNC
ncbi:hypothetical protein Gotri_025113 [Gossypium trilobum]|uniref:Copper transport protein n=1 Tax=Gossypium trilobum TaxID=34281 RepID=A0A7J9FJ90_9ROSI|nr:hypothetical protein [Gossypium trilobum]